MTALYRQDEAYRRTKEMEYILEEVTAKAKILAEREKILNRKLAIARKKKELESFKTTSRRMPTLTVPAGVKKPECNIRVVTRPASPAQSSNWPSLNWGQLLPSNVSAADSALHEKQDIERMRRQERQDHFRAEEASSEAEYMAQRIEMHPLVRARRLHKEKADRV